MTAFQSRILIMAWSEAQHMAILIQLNLTQKPYMNLNVLNISCKPTSHFTEGTYWLRSAKTCRHSYSILPPQIVKEKHSRASFQQSIVSLYGPDIRLCIRRHIEKHLSVTGVEHAPFGRDHVRNGVNVRVAELRKACEGSREGRVELCVIEEIAMRN